MMNTRMKAACLLASLAVCCCPVYAQGTVPTFTRMAGGQSYTFAGQDPAKSGTTMVPTVLVPIRLTFAGKATEMDAAKDVSRIQASPLFSRYRFATGDETQYGDALLRATFQEKSRGHTLLGKPVVKAITIHIPATYGYLLHSKRSGHSFAVVDSEYVEKELFRQLPKQDGQLVIAVTHNTTFYAAGDATVCCTWGTHGVDPATGNSFVLGSYLHDTPAIVTDRDIQPLSEQLAEFIYDPLHDPHRYFHTRNATGNDFATWQRPAQDGACGGSGIGTNYFLLEPTDSNPKNNFPSSTPYLAQTSGFDYHLQNVALLDWYMGASGNSRTYSFPDARALTEAAKPCKHHAREAGDGAEPAVTPAGSSERQGGHSLIGYWTGSSVAGSKALRLRDVSPQWDVILVAFASPAKDAPEGTLRFTPPAGVTPQQLKADIAYLKGRGKTVMISLGGGGKFFKLDDARDIPNFVSSVTHIVREYGFEGVDLDFESPSLELAAGDTDFRHPVTPAIVNLIAGLRQLRTRIGPGFKISLVPEGTQIPAGFASYGGQFGSYLPIVYALRNDLMFVDVQDYNTPPLEGLDGEIYQSHTLGYYAATMELLLHGFDVAGHPQRFFPPLPADKVVVGFLAGYEKPEGMRQAMQYIITGKTREGTAYTLRKPGGYPATLGAMLWTIDADQRGHYRYSNLVGPQLHGMHKPR